MDKCNVIFKNLDLCKVDSSIVLISDGFVFHRYGSSMSMGLFICQSGIGVLTGAGLGWVLSAVTMVGAI